MRCIYCDSKIDKYTFTSLFLKQDLLCVECRNKLKPKKQIIKINDIKVETFFEYDGFFRDVLIQYKECFDEALADIFLYDLQDYINLKYHNYRILFVPSSNFKNKIRGFNHLKLMCKDIKLRQIEGLCMEKDLSQEGKNALERGKMINNYKYNGQQVDRLLIFDDVLTTGSSIQGVYNTMFPYCNKIDVIVLATKRKRFQP